MFLKQHLSIVVVVVVVLRVYFALVLVCVEGAEAGGSAVRFQATRSHESIARMIEDGRSHVLFRGKSLA